MEKVEKQQEDFIRHISLTKFKPGVPEEKQLELMRKYAKLVHTTPMKTFKWGKELGIKGKNEGYTHIIECTFENKPEDVREYLDHPHHVEFAKEYMTYVEDRIIVDYVPGRLALD